MNVVEAFKQATEQNKKVKRVAWSTWHDPKKVYISWADVVADDWHTKSEDSQYYIGLDKDGNPVKTVLGVPNDPDLKWMLLSKFAEQQKVKS